MKRPRGLPRPACERWYASVSRCVEPPKIWEDPGFWEDQARSSTPNAPASPNPPGKTPPLSNWQPTVYAGLLGAGAHAHRGVRALPGAPGSGKILENKGSAEEKVPYLTPFLPSGPDLPRKMPCTARRAALSSNRGPARSADPPQREPEARAAAAREQAAGQEADRAAA